VRLGLCAALLAVSLLTSAAPAMARQHRFVIGPSRTSEAHLHGTNGYAVSLFGSGNQISLSVVGHHATVQYSARGRVTKQLIKARFGRFGRVALRFQPHGKPHRVPRLPGNCKGRGELVQPGVFLGTIRFIGERRYTEVHARRAEGKITEKAKEVCRQSGESGSRAGILVLDARAKNGGTGFTAFKPKSSSSPFPNEATFIASTFESHRHLSIFHTIESNAKADTFLNTMSHGELIGATIEPPAPFSGSATYLKKPATPSEGWTGDLAVEFPGVGKVSLAGSDFCAESVVLSGCEGSRSQFFVVG